MRRVRDALRFCYLCGDALPPRGPGWTKALIREHVVPRSLLGPPPSNPADQWPVLLFVHKACEEATKRGKDDLIRALHLLHSTTPESWSQTDLGMIRPMLGEVQLSDSTEATPVLRGVATVVEGLWNWVRGMHAAIYREPLPRVTRHNVFPPVPGYNQNAPGPIQAQIDRTDRASDMILGALLGGVLTDEWDGVDAWGGAVRYRCLWHPRQGTSPSWRCLWSMLVPGALEWSGSVRETPVPWHGYYARETRPNGAASLTQVQIDAANAERRRGLSQR